MATDRTPETERQTEDPETMGDLRIVLFGRLIPKNQLIKIIGDAGKFKLDPSHTDGTQQEKLCQKYSRRINDENVVIINTPGVDTGGIDKKRVLEEIKWSVAVADPGPHAFLFVEMIKNDSMSDKFKALKDFEKTFGEQANDLTMMVFINESDMKPRDPDPCGSERVKPFRELTYPFSHRYFIFYTKGNKQQQESQVIELLEKIAQMRGGDSARFYTPKMVWEAEKAVKQQEEEEQKQEVEKQKQQEEKQKQKEKLWSKIRDKLLVIGAQVGATIGFLLSFYIFNADPSSAVGGVGSIVGVIIVAVAYLVLHHFKFET